MSEIVERVAVAIEEALQAHGDEDIKAGLAFLALEPIARAAITAMREPGRDFIWNAVHNRKPMLDCIRGHDLSGDEAEKVYQAVIDAALTAASS